MRIITGSARGKRLVTPQGTDVVRPTPERVKEGLFSAIQFDIEGRRVLDLFAGSGQLGLEALSRGAESAVFVDTSEVSLAAVKQNIESTGLSGARAVRSDYASFAASCREKFDIMSDYGVIICEHPENAVLSEEIAGFSAARTYRYGKVCITLYRRKD